MATNIENVRSDRFVNRSLTELQQANRSPIDGYADEVIVPLEQAVENLIPLISNISKYVDHAKNECNKTSCLLTLNESAAIYLYTMPTCFFQLLNETLRTENRSALKPWFPFLKIFISALEKLPSSKLTVWRAVALDIEHFSLENDTITRWSVNSTSTNLTLEEYFNEQIVLRLALKKGRKKKNQQILFIVTTCQILSFYCQSMIRSIQIVLAMKVYFYYCLTMHPLYIIKRNDVKLLGEIQ